MFAPAEGVIGCPHCGWTTPFAAHLQRSLRPGWFIIAVMRGSTSMRRLTDHLLTEHPEQKARGRR